MTRTYLLLTALGLLLSSIARAQSAIPNSNVRVKYLSYSADTLVLDSLSIIPGSISIDGFDSTYFSASHFDSKFIFLKKIPSDSIQVTYRVFPYNLSKSYFHKDPALIESNLAASPFEYDATEANKSGNLIDFGTIDYSGSFGRALSFGNNQDVVLNSQFNLQLDGDLGDSIKLTGAITDNTIPFQPEGNTQQLQEFDRIFIQLQRKKTTLIVGDFDIKRPNSYFMNFYKRVQGGMVSTSNKVSKKAENTFTLGASFAKGKFVRNIITPLEGNQGPYKLTGPNGEQFFIVLAGSERVYIDGIQMQRGEQQDYIIDYNTAEVTFMPRRIITKDLRIAIEFEFSDRNFLNSLIYVRDELKVNDKLNLRMNFFSNQDAKNQSLNQNLDKTQKQFLSTIGDSIQNALYSSIKTQDTFSNSLILYKKIDTIVNSINYTGIYKFSTNPDSAKYLLSFSYVGTNKGNYIQSINAANGRVYAWIAPINGIPQGDYEPVILLVTPKKIQMLTGGIEYKLAENRTLIVEGAYTNNDPNTFSKLNNEDHHGIATKLIYDDERSVSKTNKLKLNTKLMYEFVNDKFRPIERYRNVEFLRDWNILEQSQFLNEHLGSVNLSLEKEALGKIDYQFGTFLRGNVFKGFQHIIHSQYRKKTISFIGIGNVMKQTATEYRSTFYRPYLEFEKRFPTLKDLALGTKFLMEHNQLSKVDSDSLFASAFSFDATTLYARNSPTSKNTFQAEYTLRHDRAAKGEEFALATIGNTFSLNSTISSIKNHDIKIVAAYRVLSITDTTITNFKPDESLLGRIEYNFSILKNIVTGNALYEFGSGQEPKREFTYLEVPIGQGNYVWRDYNGDNLKQLNEFELAIFPDEKRYIRVFTPTNQYVKAKYSIYNQFLSINPRNLWNESKLKGIKKVLSIIYLQSALQLNNRFLGSRGIAQYNPFILDFEDSTLINNSSSLVNSVFINRFSNVWGIEYVRNIAGGKSLLNYGIDSRRNEEHLVRGRYNLTKNIQATLQWREGSKSFSSQYLENRNFLFKTQSYEPSLIFLLLKNQLRTAFSYRNDLRKNEPRFGNEKASIHNFNFDTKYNIPSSGSIALKGTFSNISFSGNSNSTLGYAMLDGLVNGRNFLWQVSFDRRIAKNVEMTLEYEGRKPGSTSVIHTGKASIRAIF